MNESNNIIIYQSEDGKTHIEVKLEKNTVWLTQQQIADLFGVKQPAISKHFKNIFDSKELNKDSVYSILEYTAADGKVYKTGFYNLDAIISVGGVKLGEPSVKPQGSQGNIMNQSLTYW